MLPPSFVNQSTTPEIGIKVVDLLALHPWGKIGLFGSAGVERLLIQELINTVAKTYDGFSLFCGWSIYLCHSPPHFFLANIFRLPQAGSEVSALLGRILSTVGYQLTLSTKMGGM